MTRSRSLLIAMLAVAPLIGVRPVAGDAQFPRGLMSTEPREGTCTIDTRPVRFGTYDPMAATDKDAAGEVSYTCSRDRFGRLLRVRIEISPGAAGTFDRRMTSGTEHLLYNLYLDASHRKLWGDGSRGTDYYFKLLPPSDTRIAVPIYGHIPGMQDVGIGDYTDVLQVTVIF